MLIYGGRAGLYFFNFACYLYFIVLLVHLCLYGGIEVFVTLLLFVGKPMNDIWMMKGISSSSNDSPANREMQLAMSSVFLSSSSSHEASSNPALNMMRSGEDTLNVLKANDHKGGPGAYKENPFPTDEVRGPSQSSSLQEVLRHFHSLGFQASHYGKAVEIARQALELQSPSTHYAVRNGEFVAIHEHCQEVVVLGAEERNSGVDGLVEGNEPEKRSTGVQGKTREKDVHAVRPLLFLGMTAQLMGTGCREAVKFLIKEGLEPRHIPDDSTGYRSDSFISFHSCAKVENAGEKEGHLQKGKEEEKGEEEKCCRPQVFGESLLKKVGVRDIRLEEDEDEHEGWEQAEVIERGKKNLEANTGDRATHPPASPAMSSSSLPYYSFLSCIVLSGGGVEHDIRRACELYQLVAYASEDAKKNATATSTESGTEGKPWMECDLHGKPENDYVYFGNVAYPRDQIMLNTSLSSSSAFSFSCHKPERTNGGVDSSCTPSENDGMRKVGNAPSSSSPPTIRGMQEHHQTAVRKVEGDESSHWTLMDMVMSVAVRRLLERQHRLQKRAGRGFSIPVDEYSDVCPWTITPSEVWSWIGWKLPLLFAEAIARRKLHVGPFEHSDFYRSHSSPSGDPKGGTGMMNNAQNWSQAKEERQEWRKLMEDSEIRREAQERAESTVVYWAAQQAVPIFCPSFTDGDIMDYVRYATDSFLKRNSSFCTSSSLPISSVHPATTLLQRTCPPSSLAVDLVRDIHLLNYLAMSADRTAVLICGGGVIKHHICNANLMRNGADYSIFLNNGQEYDGSDGGAHPEEALSWGKLRFDGQHVKVYGEVTTMFPLLVGEVFLPAVRNRSK